MQPLEAKGAGTATSEQTKARWKATTPFNNPRTLHQSVLHGNHLYVIGGYSYNPAKGVTAYNDVQYAALGDDGNIQGKWQTTTPFQTPRSGHSCVVYKGYLYIIAGGNGNNYFDDVQYAKLNSDGTISARGWRTNLNRINVPRSVHSSLVLHLNGKSYLYVIGGVGDVSGKTVHFNTVEYAPINADGSVGRWVLSPSTFINGRSAPGCVLINGYLYVVGGWGDRDEDIFSDVQYTRLNLDGSLGLWITSKYSVQTGRYGHTCLLAPGSDSTILVLGGNAGGGKYLNDLQYTRTKGGETAAWTQLLAGLNFPMPRWGHTSITYRGRVYVIGGTALGSVFLNDVQYRSLYLKK